MLICGGGVIGASIAYFLSRRGIRSTVFGPVPGVPGAFVATGHSVWGILNAPATGEAMAELIADGASRSVDLSPFDPGRLPPLDSAGLKLASGRS